MKKQIVILVLAAVLVFGCAIGGTLAWLMDKTDTVTNVFTYGDINIDLTETGAEDDENGGLINNGFKMVPGSDITKDPTITVEAGSEDAYIFVKLEKSDNFDNFLTYTIADDWQQLDNVEGVYYREYTGNEETKYSVLADNKVTVLNEVTKEALNALDADKENVTYPTLKVTAYAVQKDNVADAATAWEIANPTTPPAEEPAE